jgi:hypothetical protein
VSFLSQHRGVDIDHWLDDPDLRTHHRREAPAPPEAL